MVPPVTRILSLISTFVNMFATKERDHKITQKGNIKMSKIFKMDISELYFTEECVKPNNPCKGEFGIIQDKGSPTSTCTGVKLSMYMVIACGIIVIPECWKQLGVQ